MPYALVEVWATWPATDRPADSPDGWKLPEFGPVEVRSAVDAVLEAGSIDYLRSGKKKTVALEGRVAREPEVVELPGAGGACVRLATRSSNEGALRPDVFMGAVKERLADLLAVGGIGESDEPSGDVLSEGYLHTSITRTAQYLEEEDGTWVRPI